MRRAEVDKQNQNVDQAFESRTSLAIKAHKALLTWPHVALHGTLAIVSCQFQRIAVPDLVSFSFELCILIAQSTTRPQFIVIRDSCPCVLTCCLCVSLLRSLSVVNAEILKAISVKVIMAFPMPFINDEVVQEHGSSDNQTTRAQIKPQRMPKCSPFHDEFTKSTLHTNAIGRVAVVESIQRVGCVVLKVRQFKWHKQKTSERACRITH